MEVFSYLCQNPCQCVECSNYVLFYFLGYLKLMLSNHLVCSTSLKWNSFMSQNLFQIVNVNFVVWKIKLMLVEWNYGIQFSFSYESVLPYTFASVSHFSYRRMWTYWGWLQCWVSAIYSALPLSLPLSFHRKSTSHLFSLFELKKLHTDNVFH